jgi:type I restriction enzyme R subunit
MKAEDLYEAPFTDLHTGGPDALFAGKGEVVEGVFNALQAAQSNLRAAEA